jgi:hypothetical protein
MYGYVDEDRGGIIMEDPHTNQPLPPMMRLPQVSPHQGRTTLRHFAPSAPPQPPETLDQTRPAPFSQASPAQTEQHTASALSDKNKASFGGYKHAKRTHIPGVFRRKLNLRAVLLGGTILLAIAIIVLVLIYYMTLF